MNNDDFKAKEGTKTVDPEFYTSDELPALLRIPKRTLENRKTELNKDSKPLHEVSTNFFQD